MLNNSLQDGKRFPDKYFFFNNLHAELRVDSESLQKRNVNIVKGYSVVMWFRAEQINKDASNKKITNNSTLFYIHTSKYVCFEVILKNRSLYYKINVDKSIDDTGFRDNSTVGVSKKEDDAIFHLCEIELGKWTMFGFSHKPASFLHKSEFLVFKDSEMISRNIDYPNLKNQKVLSVGFFKDFTGQATNVFMLNEPLSNSQLILDLRNYTYGFYNERNIRIFKNLLEGEESKNSKNISDFKNLLENLIFMYSPSRVKGNKCRDLIGQVDGEINTNIDNILAGGCVHDHNYQTNIANLGSADIFLPIFEFLSKTTFITSSVLEESLCILITLVDKRDLNQV